MHSFFLVLKSFHLFLGLCNFLTLLTRRRRTLLDQFIPLAFLFESYELMVSNATLNLLGRHFFGLRRNLRDSLQIAKMIVPFLGGLNALLTL